jgi:hypothetical protein
MRSLVFVVISCCETFNLRYSLGGSVHEAADAKVGGSAGAAAVASHAAIPLNWLPRFDGRVRNFGSALAWKGWCSP